MIRASSASGKNNSERYGPEAIVPGHLDHAVDMSWSNDRKRSRPRSTLVSSQLLFVEDVKAFIIRGCESF